MKIIVPMAGMGKRMRPHTLTIPKPLIPIVGKPIVQRLVEDIAKVAQENIDEVVFIIKKAFGKEVEERLKKVAEDIGAKGTIAYQEEALGTAHAILCAGEALKGNLIVAFADTLFKADFKLDTSAEGIIWVQKVENPKAFGVIKLNEKNQITDFVEKPETFVSDLAIIGIYYFTDGEYLQKELQYLLDNDIKDKGEFQLTNALENMKNKGTVFTPQSITEWLDCGNKDATVHTNQRYLEYIKDTKLINESAQVSNSVILPPVFIGENVKINNAIIGPHVSIGNNTAIENSIIKNSIIQENSKLKNAHFSNSMIGNFVNYEKEFSDLSIGDYNQLKD